MFPQPVSIYLSVYLTFPLPKQASLAHISKEYDPLMQEFFVSQTIWTPLNQSGLNDGGLLWYQDPSSIVETHDSKKLKLVFALF